MSADASSPTTKPSVVTIDDALNAVVEVLSEKHRDVDNVCASSTLRDLGLDSLDTAELFMALEDLSGYRLDPDSASELETVADLTRLRAL